MWQEHVWTLASALLPTISAFFAYLKAKQVGHKADNITINVNGRLSQVLERNQQLASELSKRGIELPPPIIHEES
jgi:hypothetical protein